MIPAQGALVNTSIVIPALDEGERIGPQVRRCLALEPRPEVIVADGGSADETPSLARTAGARVVLSGVRGRAFQMNAGAEAAAGEVLVFLHADVVLEQSAYETMLGALADPGLAGGAFRRRFDSPSLLLRLGCRLADLRGRWLGIFLGDQGIFVRRAHFRSLGGFPEILLFEDLEFSRRLARAGKTLLLDGVVVASSRRFDREGNLKRLGRNLGLTLLYLGGADPSALALRYYPEHLRTPGPRSAAGLARPPRFGAEPSKPGRGAGSGTGGMR